MSGLLFPKIPKKKKRKVHPKSLLMQQGTGQCYLCIMLDDNWMAHRYTEEHHILYSKHQRQLSEMYGLKVDLCTRHHEDGPMAVHRNKKVRRFLEAQGQQAFETKYGRELFQQVFGENYIYDDNLLPPKGNGYTTE